MDSSEESKSLLIEERQSQATVPQPSNSKKSLDVDVEPVEDKMKEKNDSIGKSQSLLIEERQSQVSVPIPDSSNSKKSLDVDVEAELKKLKEQNDAIGMEEKPAEDGEKKKKDLWKNICREVLEEYKKMSELITIPKKKDRIYSFDCAPISQDLKNCSPKEYLECAVFPILLSGIQSTIFYAKANRVFQTQSCEFDPLIYLAEYLWKNNPKYPGRQQKKTQVKDARQEADFEEEDTNCIEFTNINHDKYFEQSYYSHSKDCLVCNKFKKYKNCIC